MDWSKATNILIVALLITCLILGGILLGQKLDEDKAAKAAALATEEYLKSQGVSLNCDIPMDRPSLPVLFIHFKSMSLSAQFQELKSYKGIPLAFDKTSAYIPELVSAGKEKARVITASSALLKAVAQAGEAGAYNAGSDKSGSTAGMAPLVINEISLVYYVDPEGFDPTSEDTAIPSWLIKTSAGDFYINAYEQ